MGPAKSIKLYKDLHDESRRRAESHLFDFFVEAWPTIDPRFNLESNWHIGLICEHLEAVYHGEIEKLVVNIPTRYLKTNICTIAFPAWIWIQDPKKRIISWSYSGNLSSKISWDRRQLIESLWFQKYWGDKVRMADDQNQKTRYINTEKGEMFATSTGGTMTGGGCDIMIIDDPVNPFEASNTIMREKCNAFWSGTASSRFDDKKRKACVLVMQRLHAKDLSGYFLDEYPETVHLKIPNQAQENIIYNYPRTGRVKRYIDGEILQPDRENDDDLKQALRELGSYNYAAQRQQDPVPRGGGIIKEEWFRYYRQTPPFDFTTLSVDCSFKDLDSSDYVVLQAWGQAGVKHYLIKQLRAKMSFLKTKAALKTWALELFPNYREILIEDKANGTAILNSLEQVLNDLIPINPKDSKIARLVACEPDIEAGDVLLPDPDLEPWVREIFIPEVTAFPKAANDDQVDAMTQYLNRAKTRKVGSLSGIGVGSSEESSGTLVGPL